MLNGTVAASDNFSQANLLECLDVGTDGGEDKGEACTSHMGSKEQCLGFLWRRMIDRYVEMHIPQMGIKSRSLSSEVALLSTGDLVKFRHRNVLSRCIAAASKHSLPDSFPSALWVDMKTSLKPTFHSHRQVMQLLETSLAPSFAKNTSLVMEMVQSWLISPGSSVEWDLHFAKMFSTALQFGVEDPDLHFNVTRCLLNMLGRSLMLPCDLPLCHLSHVPGPRLVKSLESCFTDLGLEDRTVRERKNEFIARLFSAVSVYTQSTLRSPLASDEADDNHDLEYIEEVAAEVAKITTKGILHCLEGEAISAELADLSITYLHHLITLSQQLTR